MKIESSQFDLLWNKVEERFVRDNVQEFSLDGLKEHLSVLGIGITADDIKKLNEKYYNFLQKGEHVDVNLSTQLVYKIFEYAEITGLHDLIGNITLDEIANQVKAATDKKIPEKKSPDSIAFVGRRSETKLLESFLLDPGKKIFGLYGIPMIGKTWLIDHFVKTKVSPSDYKIIYIKLEAQPTNPQKTIFESLFGEDSFHDLSIFSEPTLVIIQNFEQVLNWTGENSHLHDIHEMYHGVKTLLQEIANSELIKVIIESRFQVNFRSFIEQSASTQTLPNIQLEGVDSDEFWPFYQTKEISKYDFEQICEKFNNHTGLLALAYNDVDWYYENNIKKAIHSPQAVTKYLWNFIEEVIISKLEPPEVWILCTLTYLKKPASEQEIISILQHLQEIDSTSNIEAYFFSLKKKLLTQNQDNQYELNPYLKEACYTFLREKRRLQMDKLAALPIIQEQGPLPVYDRVLHLLDQANYGAFYDELKIHRDRNNFEYVHRLLNYAYYNDRFINKVGVLTEMAITYKNEKKYNLAIEKLENALQKDPDNVKVLNELGINLRFEKRFEESEKYLQKACHLRNIPSFNEIAITFKQGGKLTEAKQALKNGLSLEPGNSLILNHLCDLLFSERLYQEALEFIDNALNANPGNSAFSTLKEKALPFISGKKVFISFVQQDQDIKDRLEKHLSSLKRDKKILTWDIEKIDPGQEVAQETDKQLSEATVILFLISADFISASEQFWKNQVTKAIERHKMNLSVVIPIFCQPCDIVGTPFEGIKGLPENQQAISTHSNRESALAQIATSLRKLI